MEPIFIVILTLVGYSTVSTIVYIISGENYDVLAVFGLGIFGVIIIFLDKCVVNPMYRFIRNYNKRTVFEDENGNKFYCHTKYANDLDWYYKIIKRREKKEVWKHIAPATKECIDKIQKNCDRCKHDNQCRNCGVRCKHDNFGIITEFDQFKKKCRRKL